MNAVPAERRGVASGMLATVQQQQAAMTLSIGIFFSLMIAGSAPRCRRQCSPGWHRATACRTDGGAPGREPANRVGSLFAGVLPRYNPMTRLLGPSLHTLSASQAAIPRPGATLSFPNLISTPDSSRDAHHPSRSLGRHDAGRCDGRGSWSGGSRPARPAAARVSTRTEAIELAG